MHFGGGDTETLSAVINSFEIFVFRGGVMLKHLPSACPRPKSYLVNLSQHLISKDNGQILSRVFACLKGIPQTILLSSSFVYPL